MTFKVAIERVLGHEGGYVNHPEDPGGETNWGITKRFAWKWGYRGRMKDLTRDQAVAYYFMGFWSHLLCDVWAFPLAFQLFDCAVHSGNVRAIRLMQKATGALDDGIIGRETIQAFRNCDPATACETFLALRLEFLQSLPTWETFGKGWQTRIDRNREYLKDDLHSPDFQQKPRT